MNSIYQKMKVLICILFILCCSVLVNGFDCSDYITDEGRKADEGHIEFCRAVLGNQKVIDDNLKVINSKMNDIMDFFNITRTNKTTDFEDDIVSSSFSMGPSFLILMLMVPCLL